MTGFHDRPLLLLPLGLDGRPLPGAWARPKPAVIWFRPQGLVLRASWTRPRGWPVTAYTRSPVVKTIDRVALIYGLATFRSWPCRYADQPVQVYPDDTFTFTVGPVVIDS